MTAPMMTAISLAAIGFLLLAVAAIAAAVDYRAEARHLARQVDRLRQRPTRRPLTLDEAFDSAPRPLSGGAP